MNRKLDVEIAERLFEYTVIKEPVDAPMYVDYGILQDNGLSGYLPKYSSNMEACMAVLKVLRSRHCCLNILSDYEYTWTIKATIPECVGNPEHEEKRLYDGPADLAEAICLAAIKWLGSKEV